MSERREDTSKQPEKPVIKRMFADDLAALRARTARDLPPLDELTRPATAGALPGGFAMNIARTLKKRPWLTTALATAAVAVILLFIPISYGRLTGNEVSLALSGPGLEGDGLHRIATEFGSTFHAQKLTVSAHPDGAVLTALIPDRSWRQVAKLTIDYARGLAGRGVTAVPTITPRVEKVRGSVYAAMNGMIEIRVQCEGKSDSQIADDIRGQMEAAGLQNPSVEVNRNGKCTQIQIRAERDSSQAGEGELPDINVSLTGDAPDTATAHTVKHLIRVHRTEGMTDQQLIDDVKQQLEAQGVHNPNVTIENGQIRVQDMPGCN